MFSEHAWNKLQNIYQKILHQPFFKELESGDLAQNKLNLYLKQDSFFAIELAKSLYVCASRSLSTQASKKLLKLADKALEYERKLHQPYFKEYNITHKYNLTPSCFTYTQLLKLTTKHDSLYESFASLLPCVSICMAIGKHLATSIKSNNPFYRWVEWYTSKDFATILELTIEITDNAANNISEALYIKMLNTYLLCAKLESIFCMDAYNINFTDAMTLKYLK